MTKLRPNQIDDHVDAFEHFKPKSKRESVTRSSKQLEAALETQEQTNRKLSKANLLLTSILKRITKWLPKSEQEKIEREIEAASIDEVHP